MQETLTSVTTGKSVFPTSLGKLTENHQLAQASDWSGLPVVTVLMEVPTVFLLMFPPVKRQDLFAFYSLPLR